MRRWWCWPVARRPARLTRRCFLSSSLPPQATPTRASARTTPASLSNGLRFITSSVLVGWSVDGDFAAHGGGVDRAEIRVRARIRERVVERLAGAERTGVEAPVRLWCSRRRRSCSMMPDVTVWTPASVCCHVTVSPALIVSFSGLRAISFIMTVFSSGAGFAVLDLLEPLEHAAVRAEETARASTRRAARFLITEGLRGRRRERMSTSERSAGTGEQP